MAKQIWKPGNMIYPLPAVMVSVTDGEGNDNIITVAWTGTVCTNPAMAYISVRPSRYSYDMIRKTGEFVINLTTEKLAFATDFCGVRSGRDVDKFQKLNLTKEKAQYVSAPMIEEAPVSIECRVREIKELGSFVPSDRSQREKRCEEILSIQSQGLKKRLEHTGCKCAVVGISGGLDSTLALLVTVRAFDMLGLDRAGIFGVTMPGFGTTNRTYDNAVKMIKCVQATFREVSIKDAVRVHFRDIGQEETCHDVTYENSQARERTS